MVPQLDHLDLNIISQLNKDGRISITELAKKVKSTRLTVSKRLQRLINQELIIVGGGLNLKKLGFKVANVGLEMKSEPSRIKTETILKDCPRVLAIYRTPGKANVHLTIWGEDEQTIKSTIESFRDLPNVDIIYIRYLGTPIHGNIIINVAFGNKDETPCGKKCTECYKFENAWCFGCPTSKHYKNPLLT